MTMQDSINPELEQFYSLIGQAVAGLVDHADEERRGRDVASTALSLLLDQSAHAQESSEAISAGLRVVLHRLERIETALTMLGEVAKVAVNATANTVKIQMNDLNYWLHAQAAQSTAEFIRDNCPTARQMEDRWDVINVAASVLPQEVEGLVLEFGVAGGRSLRALTQALPGRRIFGFDCFEGLPEDWRIDMLKGQFAQQEVPQVPGAELVVGLFEDSLPGWVAENPDEPIALLHLDADLYSSTRTALDHIGHRLVEGSIVVFDEYFNYIGWTEHEHKAWSEFVQASGIEFDYLAYTKNHQQLIVQVTKVSTS